MPINLSPNFAEIARITKAVGGFAVAAGVALGAITPALAPLAATFPAAAALAPLIAALGLLFHGLGTGSKALLETLSEKGLINQGPK